MVETEVDLEAEAPSAAVPKTKAVGVHPRHHAWPVQYCAGELSLRVGDRVIVEGKEGVEFGIVSTNPLYLDSSLFRRPLGRVLRLATEHDLRQVASNETQEVEAREVFKEKLAELGLPMRLLDVDIPYGGRKITFFFSAEGRVDFRELVRVLARHFRMRVELRQLGARDQAQRLGGCGSCGRPLCCSTWLGEFVPISVRMAKDQNLTLNADKLTGLSGRLKDCLRYEHAEYVEARKKLPRVGKSVDTPFGLARVVREDLLFEEVTLEFPDGNRRKVAAGELVREEGRFRLRG
ncbi:MAG: stage 0 sporulation family protein [Nitrospinota bacterium]